MGRALLCTGKYADIPYHFSKVCVNIYCVEELCYLFTSNPFMIDSDIMDKKLADWLDMQCGLSELSHQLLTLFRRGSQLSTFVGTILDYVNYCTQEEKKKIEGILQANVGLNNFEKHKSKADFLTKNKRFRLAIDEYDTLLEELPEAEIEIRPDICHNLGVAYAGLFLYENAARYFKKAYEISGREESGTAYLQSLRHHLREEDYIAFIGEHGEYYELSLKVEKKMTKAREEFETTQQNRMLNALSIYKEEGNTASYYEEINKIISDIKSRYRECVAD